MANSPRPGVWVLERSVDNGTTWQPWQYFAGNNRECQKFFGVYSFESRDPKVISSDDEVRSLLFYILIVYCKIIQSSFMIVSIHTSHCISIGYLYHGVLKSASDWRWWNICFLDSRKTRRKNALTHTWGNIKLHQFKSFMKFLYDWTHSLTLNWLQTSSILEMDPSNQYTT